MIARTERGNRERAALHRWRPAPRQLRRLAVAMVSTAAITLPMATVGEGTAHATVGPGTAHAAVSSQGAGSSGWTRLSMQGGWTTSPFGTSAAAVRVISGIVYFKGGIATTHPNPVPFTLPAAFRPAATVFIPVDLCNATNGRLEIQPGGIVIVQAEGGAFSNAACFTSLDGASFAKSAVSFTRLRLLNGWFRSPFGTSRAAARVISGIVHLKGAIATTGSNPIPFTLPAAFRPSTIVDIKVDLCTQTNGRLLIQPSGTVTVQAEHGAFANAACFTSLDGASFALSATSFTRLQLVNGWTNAPFGTSAAAARVISGIVHLKGAIATGGTNEVPFTLPAAFRPRARVIIPVDLCDATNGRLQIEPTGMVTVEAESGAFSNAACFTSLDGASFAR
jgi:hypothetical protein